jgi:uncharacterized membrane protein YqgA involved in biofilm formation
MVGTIVNAAAIILGSLVGLLFKKGIPERVNKTVMRGLALCVILIGLMDALKVNNLMIVIFSIVIGGIAGELLNINDRIKSLGDRIGKKFSNSSDSVSKGFVTSSLLFCVGAMAIVGSLEDGLTGNHKTLFAKSILDGISSIIFSSSLGIGVILSSVSVFLYQGIITLAASSLSGLLTKTVISDVTAAGGLLIIGLGFNMLEICDIKVANLLPSVFIPILYQLIIDIYKVIIH